MNYAVYISICFRSKNIKTYSSLCKYISLISLTAANKRRTWRCPCFSKFVAQEDHFPTSKLRRTQHLRRLFLRSMQWECERKLLWKEGVTKRNNTDCQGHSVGTREIEGKQTELRKVFGLWQLSQMKTQTHAFVIMRSLFHSYTVLISFIFVYISY